ncbi:MAG: outer membrane beta-barrel protein [Pseudobdellovibrionaceae bacterium]
MKQVFALVFAFLMSASAHAGFMIEPYLGYRSGNLENTDLSNVSKKDKYTSPVLGARVGWSFLGLWTGLDYEMGVGGKSKPETGASRDVDTSIAYLTVGFNFPVMFRAWVGYGVMADLDADQSGSKSTLTDGAPLKVGFGYTGLPLVSINFEYLTWEPETIESGGSSIKVSDSYSKYEFNAMMLSVSIPL